MSFIRSSAKVLVGAVTVPSGIAFGAVGGAVAGLVVGGMAGGIYGWQTAGAIVGEKLANGEERKSAAAIQAEAIYSFLPSSIRKASSEHLARQLGQEIVKNPETMHTIVKEIQKQQKVDATLVPAS